jgi:hypothetical protein
VIAALARACEEDIQSAWRAIQPAAHPRIHTFLATSDIPAQTPNLARRVLEAGLRRGAAGAFALPGCRVLSRGRHAH